MNQQNSRMCLIKCALVLLVTAMSGCRIAKNRPILEIPDKDKDRMEKVIFVGTDEAPKYWMSKVTVVNTTFGYNGFLFEGQQSDAQVGYFEFTRDKLKFNNMVNRRALESPDVASQGVDEIINEWGIEHTQIRLVEEDGYPTNREEENDHIHWYQKTHFTIDWSQADISEASTFPYSISISQNRSCWKKKTARVVNKSRTLLEEYISFTIAVEYEQDPQCAGMKRWNRGNFVQTVHYKYSFKKVPDPRREDTNYTPYVYTGEQDPLLKKYGFFRIVRPAINKEDKRDENVFYMSRWNPNKKHTFYFTKDYPNEYKHIAYGVICNTNKLFAKNGLSNYPLDGQCTEDGRVLPKEDETCSTGICFELKENPGHLEFGDIRYSFFHMLKTDIVVLGYGPSDAHPATGEIVAGNVVIGIYSLDFYIKYMVDSFYKRDHETYYDNEIQQRVEGNKTKYEESHLFQKMKQTLKEDDHQLWTKTSELIDVHSKIRPDLSFWYRN